MYVVGSGIDYQHTEFGGRAIRGFDGFLGANNTNGKDCNGAGTHSAGIIGGTTSGIARGTKLISVRVANCTNTTTVARTILGLEWAGLNKVANPNRPAVLYLGILFAESTLLETAVPTLRDVNGLVTISPAGDLSLGNNSCFYSPARNSITFSASDRYDEQISHTVDPGECGPLYFAPGDAISSAKLNGGSEVRNLSNTAAAAHGAGVAALYKATTPNATPADIIDWIDAHIATSAIEYNGDRNGHLLQTGGL